ncbi:hypothetical protein N7508_001086 [Penicillium antarcticum]|nr:uncharacterized protein N7508_001086 [Penicillium antarcticum]KAJ5316578.1 hypothetical protein N7508_001086 [Penicillium antarcticum]
MPHGNGTLTCDKGQILGQFEVDGAQYIFVGKLSTFTQSFSVTSADVAFESADQLQLEPEDFEEIPIEKDCFQLRLVNGVSITGGFDMPFTEAEVKKGVAGGTGKWLKL